MGNKNHDQNQSKKVRPKRPALHSINKVNPKVKPVVSTKEMSDRTLGVQSKPAPERQPLRPKQTPEKVEDVTTDIDVNDIVEPTDTGVTVVDHEDVAMMTGFNMETNVDDEVVKPDVSNTDEVATPPSDMVEAVVEDYTIDHNPAAVEEVKVPTPYDIGTLDTDPIIENVQAVADVRPNRPHAVDRAWISTGGPNSDLTTVEEPVVEETESIEEVKAEPTVVDVRPNRPHAGDNNEAPSSTVEEQDIFDEELSEKPEFNKFGPKLTKSTRAERFILVSSVTAEEADAEAQPWVDLMERDAAYREEIEGLIDPSNETKIELAEKYDVPIGGVDFDSGNTGARDACFNISGLYKEPAFHMPKAARPSISLKSIPTTKASKNPNAFFTSLMGLGQPTETTFHNSGFKVTFRYPSISEQSEFADALESGNHKLGYDTFRVPSDSGEYLHVVRLIVDLAEKLVISSTLNVDDPVSYIARADLDILALSIIASIYPKGLALSIPCVATTILLNNKPKCSNEIKGLIDPLELIYMDEAKVNPTALELSSRTQRGSVSLEDIQEVYDSMSFYTMSIQTDRGPMTINMFDGYISDYITAGLNLLEYIENKALSHIQKPTTKDIDKAITEFGFDPIKHNILVNTIEVDGQLFDNTRENIGNLDIIFRTEEADKLFGKILEDMLESKSVRVGIPAFSCGCGENNGFDGLRPINPIRVLVVAVQTKV